MAGVRGPYGFSRGGGFYVDAAGDTHLSDGNLIVDNSVGRVQSPLALFTLGVGGSLAAGGNLNLISTADATLGEVRIVGTTRVQEQAAPGTPASGTVFLYAKVDGLLYSKDDAGAETLVSGVAFTAASLLLGRGAGGGAGPAQEITLGTNLSMSGTTLNASGGGGGSDVALVVSSDSTIAASTGRYAPGYYEINADVTVEIGDDAVLEIG